MKNFIILILAFIIASCAEQEVPTILGEPVSVDELHGLSFPEYELYRINIETAYRVVQDSQFVNEIEWRLGERTIRVHLEEHDIRHPDFSLQLLTDHGVEYIDPGPNTTYRGWNLSNSEEVRLTITESWISGFITDDNGEELFIQPVEEFLLGSEQTEGLFVIYTKDDIIEDTTLLCGTPVSEEISDSLGDVISLGCVEAETAIAADRSMYTKFGNNATNLSNHLIGIKNLAEANYGVFDVKFSVKTVFIVTTSDPWTSSTDYVALLNDFTCWAGNGSSGQLGCTGKNGFGVTNDVAELWTNRDFNGGVIGIAWVGTVCNSMLRTSANQHFSTNNQALRVLIAHEVGHNFGSGHDASGTPWVMAPSVNTSATLFSSTSQSSIKSRLGGYGCLGACGTTPPPPPPPPACVVNLTINSSPSNGLFEASNSITTSGNVTVTTSAIYSAPTVTLSPGFTVQPGATFEIKTTGCN